MRQRLRECFQELRSKRGKALIPFITAGDPSLDISREIALGLVSRGADIIELGFPFSDPVADGPTIQKSYLRALEGGTTLPKVFDLAHSIRKETDVPLVLLTYYNPVYRTGIKEFVERALAAGLDGLVIPDLSFEESGPLREEAGEELAVISFVSPYTSRERIKIISREARGFLYCISAKGVTGARKEMTPEIPDIVSVIREQTDLPLALGFGISTPGQVEEVAAFVEAIIIGSALVEKVATIKNREDVGNFLDVFSDFRERC